MRDSVGKEKMIMQTEKVKKLEEQVYQLENKSENLAYAV
jgi:polyhydroxyalkanoate synthesis regulator phasin